MIAVQIAVRGGGQADQQGALIAIAAEPFGFVVLVVVVDRARRVRQLAGARGRGTGFRWASGWERTQRRIGAGATAARRARVALIGVRLLVTGSSGSSSSGSQETTAGLLALPARPAHRRAWSRSIILVIAGATAWTGIRGRFAEDLDWSRLPAQLRDPSTGSGSPGHVLRAVAFAVMARALRRRRILRSDPSLGRRPRRGAQDPGRASPTASLLLLVVALGFVAFGLFCGAEAWARRV